jgi:colicin import membrane protein
MDRKTLAATLAAVALGGCWVFRGRGPELRPVSDADFGVLSPDQMGPVDTARGSLFAARDAVVRAQLRLREARNEVDLARLDRTAAQAEAQRAAGTVRAAGESADPSAQARAKELAEAARLRIEAAQAHATYAERLVEARKADVEAAGARVRIAEAELERSKLTALEEARIPAARNYDPRPLDALVARAQSAAQERAAAARAADQRAAEAQGAWRTLSQRYQARISGIGAGTPGVRTTGGAGTGPAGSPGSTAGRGTDPSSGTGR